MKFLLYFLVLLISTTAIAAQEDFYFSTCNTRYNLDTTAPIAAASPTAEAPIPGAGIITEIDDTIFGTPAAPTVSAGVFPCQAEGLRIPIGSAFAPQESKNTDGKKVFGPVKDPSGKSIKAEILEDEKIVQYTIYNPDGTINTIVRHTYVIGIVDIQLEAYIIGSGWVVVIVNADGTISILRITTGGITWTSGSIRTDAATVDDLAVSPTSYAAIFTTTDNNVAVLVGSASTGAKTYEGEWDSGGMDKGVGVGFDGALINFAATAAGDTLTFTQFDTTLPLAAGETLDITIDAGNDYVPLERTEMLEVETDRFAITADGSIAGDMIAVVDTSTLALDAQIRMPVGKELEFITDYPAIASITTGGTGSPGWMAVFDLPSFPTAPTTLFSKTYPSTTVIRAAAPNSDGSQIGFAGANGGDYAMGIADSTGTPIGGTLQVQGEPGGGQIFKGIEFLESTFLASGDNSATGTTHTLDLNMEIVSGNIPEFSLTTLLLAVLISGFVLMFVIRRKK